MRRRTQALIEAYLSLDTARLRHLREAFGVTHLILDLRHFRGDKPTYFPPFDEIIASVSAVPDAEQAIARLIGRASVFCDGDLVVLDLDRLCEGCQLR